MSLSEFTCPSCGGGVAFYSRRRDFTEKYILPLLLLRPFRCADCLQRCYRMVFMHAKQPRERKDVTAEAEGAVREHGQRIA
jgi:hypothetical protein